MAYPTPEVLIASWSDPTRPVRFRRPSDPTRGSGRDPRRALDILLHGVCLNRLVGWPGAFKRVAGLVRFDGFFFV